MEYLGLLADDGNNGLRLIARYDDAMPGWQFADERPVLRGRFRRRRQEGSVRVQRGRTGAMPYVGMLRSSGTGFTARPAATTRTCRAGRCGQGDRTWSATSPAKAARTYGSSTARLVDPLPGHAALDWHVAIRCRSATTVRCPAGRCVPTTATMSATSTATARPTSTYSTG